MSRVHIRFIGHVQHVRFRRTLTIEANELGLAGRVWNDDRDDRVVHAELQGDADDIRGAIGLMGRRNDERGFEPLAVEVREIPVRDGELGTYYW